MVTDRETSCREKGHDTKKDCVQIDSCTGDRVLDSGRTIAMDVGKREKLHVQNALRLGRTNRLLPELDHEEIRSEGR